ncbi:MAG TPA: radical SAM protein [Puia sp.]|nr:radical SAM protein [Puia sp.]
MNRILMTHAYFLRLDPKQWSIGLPYPPLGTLYGAACLREVGYQVSVFDTQFCEGPTAIKEALAAVDADIFVIYDDGFNYLTKMCLTNMRQAALTMIALAKARGMTVIVSGSDATDHYREYLNEGADFILIGEAENTLVQLANALGEGIKDFSGIAGLAYKEDEKFFKTKPRSVMTNLDALPWPAWDLIDLTPYRTTWTKHAGYFSLNMATTRGCPFKCNWCAKPIYGNRYNARSPQQVVAELKWLKAQYHFDHIWFCDDIFGLKPGWLNEFAGLLEKENLKFRFKIQARADLLLQENNVSALARAGCENIWMGAESGSQKILDAMDKGIRVEQVKEATRLIRKHNMNPSFFIQFGYPGENKSDIEMTIRMINELLPYELGISVSYPLPGTVFYERVRNDMQQKTNWTDSDEMALMFRNTFQPAFYKQLHRFVHRSYRKHLAYENARQFLKAPLHGGWRQLVKSLRAFYYIPATLIDKRKLNQLERG